MNASQPSQPDRPERAYVTPREVVAATGITARNLSFYQDQGLLPPSDRAGAPRGARLPVQVIEQVRFIQALRAVDVPVAVIHELLPVHIALRDRVDLDPVVAALPARARWYVPSILQTASAPSRPAATTARPAARPGPTDSGRRIDLVAAWDRDTIGEADTGTTNDEPDRPHAQRIDDRRITPATPVGPSAR